MSTSPMEVASVCVGILVVDDDPEVHEYLKNALASVEGIRFYNCCSAEEVMELPTGVNVDVAILDVRFEGDVTRISELVGLVEERWPEAPRLILSNYTEDLEGEVMRRVDDCVSKAKFQVNPSSLVSRLRAIIRKSRAIDADLRKAVLDQLEHLEDGESDEILLELVGRVSEVHPPYIDVIVREEAEAENSSPRFKRLRMCYEVFKAVGIVGSDMRFRYRMFRRHNRIISEVLPQAEHDQSLEPSEQGSGVLARLDEIQRSRREGIQNE